MKIPKIIHKVIILDNMETPEFSPELKVALNSFRQNNPGYQLKIYNGNDCIAYIKKHYNDEVLWAFLKLKSFCYQTDLFRQLVLYNEGGFYSDMRQLCLKAFDECFPKKMEWFSAKDRMNNYMCNGFIASVAGHPWTKEMIRRILSNIKANYYGKNPLYPTGPKLFDEVCQVKINSRNCCIGFYRQAVVRELSADADFYIFDQGENVFLKTKIDKPDGGKYSGGEWENDNGNNYNQLWHDRDIYYNKKSLKNITKKYACEYKGKFFQDIPVKIRYTPEKFLDFYQRKGNKIVPRFAKRIIRYSIRRGIELVRFT